MKKFIITYHAPLSALEQMQNTPPEQAEEGMKLWMQWAEKCGDHLVDLGTPLAGGQKLKVDGGSEPSERQVCGYSILRAENMEQAKEFLQGHPHLAGWEAACEIEVHEAMPLPG